MEKLKHAILALGVLSILITQTGCTLIGRVLRHGGEEQLTKAPPAVAPAGPHVLILALDGGGHDVLMQAIRSGDAPFIAALMGQQQSPDLFAHAYSAPDVETILPSSTVAAWSAIFTGAPPADDGIAGDEWFDRLTRKFYAPVPVTVRDTGDFTKMVTDDLVGRQLAVPTLYDLEATQRSYVSMLMVYRGATLFTTIDPSAFTGMTIDLLKGALVGEDAEKSVAGSLDLSSVQKVTEAIKEHGLPNLQVVYFPGLDIYTHEAENPLHSQLYYYKHVVDPAVGQILEAYRQNNALKDTYVLIIADHGHTPVMKDDAHAIGTGADTPFGLLKQVGFRVRRPLLEDPDKDYQAVVASQGFMEYIYLADRSTCPHDDDQCRWGQPPRFDQDVRPVLRALYRSNRWGKPIPRLKGTIDLIFSRKPVGAGVDANPFEIFNGHRLVPISDYLERHPRNDLIDLERRMNWLGNGKFGNRAGDIILLARTGPRVPIAQRYYFASESHYSWHGSAEFLDGNIPLILARESSTGEELRQVVRQAQGNPPSELDITPLVRSLFQSTTSSAPHSAAQQ
ncbi:MAG TPA: alkaline phosphatase family protein [Candidatus Binataceae bacterium]|nr:alkaline phosphatase family protein [Candidatus Binataceae bacterium]